MSGVEHLTCVRSCVEFVNTLLYYLENKCIVHIINANIKDCWMISGLYKTIHLISISFCRS